MSYYEPERSLEPPEPMVDGILVCAHCEEIIPGGESYFEISGHNYCIDCAEYLFKHIAPYRDDYAPES